MKLSVRRWSMVGVLIMGLVLLTRCIPAPESGNPPIAEGKLSVYFLDVEQGNCILIVSPTGIAALVDAGTGQEGDGHSDTDPVQFIRTVAGNVADFRLQVIIATHYDADHIGKLDDVLDATPALVADDYRLYTRQGGWVKPTPPCDAYWHIQAVSSEHHVTLAPGGNPIDLGGGVGLSCYAAGGAYWNGARVQSASLSPTDENGRSVALVLTYRQVKMWFAGDLGRTVEEALAPHLPDVDVYAVDHHGSNGSSSLGFLQTLKPEYAICQSGDDNTYGHPNKEAVNRILSVSTTDGGHPKFIQQNHAKSGDPRSDDGLAFAIADPDGIGSLPGTITVTTDGQTDLAIQTSTNAWATELERFAQQ